ncbi:polysaccharide pyruvyl transferase family protein [Devosia sp. A16]|uniref:polysaccharide pyruvyl transferase family protein n=1 Tax=Devosia sp. A16 TaxID=1736675 RepID=UPI0009E90904|nr:polysaccharide pyruvyl transferase family protein [Devosia sp. A16]
MRILFIGAPIAPPDAELSLANRFGYVGHNTGNLLIGQSLHDVLQSSAHGYGLDVSPARVNEEYDLIAVAAANFIFKGFDLSHYAEFIEATTLPVIVAGLGAQAPQAGAKFLDIPEGSKRFLKVISERSKLIGVRGHFSAEVMGDFGITNVCVVGCPSFYRSHKRDLHVRRPQDAAPARVSINGSRDTVEHSRSPALAARVESDLIRLTIERGHSYVLQSELPEMQILAGDQLSNELVDTLQSEVKRHAIPLGVPQYAAHVRERYHAFFNLDQWDQYIKDFDLSVGSRFHGNLIALTNGVPAMVLNHDSRTTELSELMSIPHATIEDAVGLDPIALANAADFDQLEARYRVLYDRFAHFLETNGLEHRLSNAQPVDDIHAHLPPAGRIRPRESLATRPMRVRKKDSCVGDQSGMSITTAPKLVYHASGHCPICETDVEFTAQHDWYRDHLLCSRCGSIPRERALALVLGRRFPNWRNLAIHESSPHPRGASLKLKRECKSYVASHYFPGKPLGMVVDGFRNEDLEVQTFLDESFDLVVTLDVMEHVNQPGDVLREVERTLKPGGAYIFTSPTYKDRVTSERRALYNTDGSILHHAAPEYHGNPINDAGSLVTFHYGYDFAERVFDWSGLDVEVVRFHDHSHGLIGEFTEVYVATKPRDTRREVSSVKAPLAMVETRWPEDIRSLCETAAISFGVSPEVHAEDFIFRFIHDHPGFPSKASAVDYYFSDGARSAAKVRAFVDRFLGDDGQHKTILEFAAGYGAVTRHAVGALLPHTLHSSDIHPQANAFLERQMSVDTVQSVDTPEALVLPTEYDAIFALSFFSHMPRSTWGRWLKRLCGGLRQGGVLLFTTHGQTSMQYFPQAVLDRSGFWFDKSSEQGDLETATYGQTITSQSFVEARIKELEDVVEYLEFEPAGWWEHQDTYVLRKL